MKMGIMGDLNVTVTDIRDPAGLFCRGQMIRKETGSGCEASAVGCNFISSLLHKYISDQI